MEIGKLSSIEKELADLRKEHEALILMYGQLKWALEYRSNNIRAVFGISTLRAKILSAFMQGREFTVEQLRIICWDNEINNSAVTQTLYGMKKQLPWFKIDNITPGLGRGSGRSGYAVYRLSEKTKEFVQRRLDEAI